MVASVRLWYSVILCVSNTVLCVEHLMDLVYLDLSNGFVGEVVNVNLPEKSYLISFH